MKALGILVVIISFLFISGCDDAGKQTSTEAKKITEKYTKALDAAKDVERQLLEVDAQRRALVDKWANPSAN